jgi:hypothetical protein
MAGVRLRFFSGRNGGETGDINNVRAPLYPRFRPPTLQHRGPNGQTSHLGFCFKQ